MTSLCRLHGSPFQSSNGRWARQRHIRGQEWNRSGARGLESGRANLSQKGIVLVLGPNRSHDADTGLLLTFRRWRRQFPAIFCGWAGGAWEPGPADAVNRLTRQPDGPLAATHRAPDPVMPQSPRRPQSRDGRQLSPPTTRLPKTPLPPASFRNVATFVNRSDRAEPPRFDISQILCF